MGKMGWELKTVLYCIEDKSYHLIFQKEAPRARNRQTTAKRRRSSTKSDTSDIHEARRRHADFHGPNP
jgi:hypothetical protein